MVAGRRGGGQALAGGMQVFLRRLVLHQVAVATETGVTEVADVGLFARVFDFVVASYEENTLAN